MVDFPPMQEELQDIQEEESNMALRRPLCECQPSVLCVDDMSFNLIPLVGMIKKWFKIDSDVAVNGKQALDKYTEGLNKPCMCEHRTYKLIIMDVSMPVMNGDETAKRILDL